MLPSLAAPLWPPLKAPPTSMLVRRVMRRSDLNLFTRSVFKDRNKDRIPTLTVLLVIIQHTLSAQYALLADFSPFHVGGARPPTRVPTRMREWGISDVIVLTERTCGCINITVLLRRYRRSVEGGGLAVVAAFGSILRSQ